MNAKLILLILFGIKILQAKYFEATCSPHKEFVRDPFNCSVFYQCDFNGEPNKMECFWKLCFNIQTSLCDYCENVPECMVLSTTTFDTTETTEDPDPLYPCPVIINGSVFFSHATDCAKFYFCKKDQLYANLGFCAEGLWFSSMSTKCVVPWDDICYLSKQ